MKNGRLKKLQNTQTLSSLLLCLKDNNNEKGKGNTKWESLPLKKLAAVECFQENRVERNGVNCNTP